MMGSRVRGESTWPLLAAVAVVVGVLVAADASAGDEEWGWIEGSQLTNQLGVYADPDPANNTPGARNGASAWITASGDLYLFGGHGYGVTSALGRLNDLWRYDPAASTWTWSKGSSAIDQAGFYGVRGVADASNTPGARRYAASWTAPTGDLYLFGGSAASGFLNDLWRFDASSGNWVWMKGSNAANQAGVYSDPNPANNTPGARYVAVSWVGALGELYLFGGNGLDGTGATGRLNDLWRYDPMTDLWTWIEGSSARNPIGVYTDPDPSLNTPGARQAGAGFTDASGRLYLFGGDGLDSVGTLGRTNDLWRYDPTSGLWSWIKGGKTVNAAGVYNDPDPANNTPGARYLAVSCTGASGESYLLGGDGLDGAAVVGYLNDLWRYDPASNNWTWLKGGTGHNDFGVYSDPDPANNTPGARRATIAWADASDCLYVFGGDGYGASALGRLNDLWRFEPATPPEVFSAAATDATTVQVVFNEDMRDDAALVDAANYTFSGGAGLLTASDVTRLDSRSVSVTVNEMTDDADYMVYVETGSGGPTDLVPLHVDPAHDSAGFVGIGEAPTAALSSSAPDPTNAAITVDVALSEASDDLEAEDVVVTNAAVGDFTGSDDTYRFVLSPIGDGLFSCAIGIGTFMDLAGNTNALESNTVSRTYDGTGPSATLSSADPDPTNGAVTVDVALSESSSTFGLEDVTPTNANLDGFAGSDMTYSFVMTPVAEGVFSCVVEAGSFSDLVGNTNALASAPLARTFDVTPPTATLSSAAGAYVNGPITVEVALDEPCQDLSNGTVTPTNATVMNMTPVGPVPTAQYQFALAPLDENEFSCVIAAGNIEDLAGNASTAASNTISRIFDATAPTAGTVTSDAGAYTVDSTQLAFSWSGFEDLGSGIQRYDVALGTSSSPEAYEVYTDVGLAESRVFTNGPYADGEYLCSVRCFDNSGRFTTSTGTVSVDTQGPAVQSIALAGDPYTNAASVQFTVTFDEAVTGVDLDGPFEDFAVVTSDKAVSGAAVVATSGSGATYTVTVSTGIGDGTLGLKVVDNDTVSDKAGNPLGGPGAGNGDYTGPAVFHVDRTAPGVSIGEPSKETTSSGPVTYDVTYTDAASVTLDADDVQLVKHGTARGSVGVSGSGTAKRTVTISGISGNGSLAISVADDTARDLAGNQAPSVGPSESFTVESGLPLDWWPTALVLTLAFAIGVRRRARRA